MEKVTLVKNGERRDFGLRAAKIAREHLGWSEVIPMAKPKELGKVLPPEITRPVKLIKPPLLGVPKAEPTMPVEKVESIDGTDPLKTIIVNKDQIEPVFEKPARKTPVRSKTTKK